MCRLRTGKMQVSHHRSRWQLCKARLSPTDGRGHGQGLTTYCRCRRLNRDCRPAPRTRKMNPVRSSAAAKTAQLERRLDELTSLLQATAQPSSIPADPPLSDSGFSSTSHASPQSQTHPQPQPTLANVPQAEARLPDVFNLRTEDYEVLDSFRLNRLPSLPFMYIPPNTNPETIKSQYPFLWHCMVTLYCKDTPRRYALHTELKSKAAQALLVNCERSLDLLLGVLTYLTWVGFECQPRKASLGPYMQMLAGLVMDIGLNRPPPVSPDMPGLQFMKIGPGPACKPWVSLVRTMDERRAVVSCFLVSSALSHTLGRSDSLRWTPYMSECLDILAQANEVPGDALLVNLVRTQLVVDKIITDLGSDCDGIKDRDSAKAPISFYIKGLQAQIDNIRTSIPPELAQNKTLTLHLHHAETAIYELAMTKPSTSTDDFSLTRLDQLATCLSAVQARFSILFTLPDTAFAYFPSTMLFPTAHSLIALLRLSTFEYPGWDLAAVRQTLDILATTQRVADKMAQVPTTLGIKNDPNAREGEFDCFTGASRVLNGLRATWAAKLPELTPQAQNQAQPQTAANPPVAQAQTQEQNQAQLQMQLQPQDFDQELVDTWLSAQDVAWLTDFPLYGGGLWGN
ncbi:hypothetical protein BJY04DRAFT_191050 [Aspergillus karnatakaensis]|uniref:fungal specific transcription factor domain-containing protein n=1 Tax=Aspergillus karnatakaensis TaxID=1810916 RepID=UPI003CCC92A4